MIYKENDYASILHKKTAVLNKGYVELCNFMGNDETVVRCARQSYGKDEDDLSEATIERQIRDMLERGHTSPFEQVVFQFHIKMPIFVQRELIRHRTARVNEISGRYTKFSNDNFYVPEVTSLEYRKSYPEVNSSEEPHDKEDAELYPDIVKLISATIENNVECYGTYSKLLEKDLNIPYELARVNLPLSLYTEFYWQIDLHNLMHFLKLRLDEHAQKEIREYAIVIYRIVKEICPITMKYFIKNDFNSLKLNAIEISFLKEAFLKLTALVDRSEGVECLTDDEMKLKDKIYAKCHTNNIREKYLDTMSLQENIPEEKTLE
jgi:thymidylate synthase (FAD)